MDVAALLDAHDRQVRRSLAAAPGFVAEDLGLVVRVTAPPGSSSSFIEWSNLESGDADAEIAEQVAWFEAREQAFEWKTYGRDRPADLGERLQRSGFVAGDEEAFVVGEVADVLRATAGHDITTQGIEVRDASRADAAGMQALSASVWGDDAATRFDELFTELAAAPEQLRLFVVTAEQRIVSFGWVRLPSEDFATLWGGSTHPGFRGRGFYRALVRHRALVAQRAGRRYLQVDCTPGSRPILEPLGLEVIDTTTPYRWHPR